METALRALSGKQRASSEDAPTPPGFEVIDRVDNPVDKAQLLVLTVSNLPDWATRRFDGRDGRCAHEVCLMRSTIS